MISKPNPKFNSKPKRPKSRKSLGCPSKLIRYDQKYWFKTWRKFLDMLPDDITNMIMEMVIPKRREYQFLSFHTWCGGVKNSSVEPPLYIYPTDPKLLLRIFYRKARQVKKRFVVMFKSIAKYNYSFGDIVPEMYHLPFIGKHHLWLNGQ